MRQRREPTVSRSAFRPSSGLCDGSTDHEAETGREVGAVQAERQLVQRMYRIKSNVDSWETYFESNALCTSPRKPPGELVSAT